MFQSEQNAVRPKDVFTERRHAQSTQKQVAKSSGCGEKPLPSYVTHTLLRQECDTPTTTTGICTNRGKRILGRSECLPPLGLPPESYFLTAHNLATHLPSHHSAVQLLPRETSFKLRPSAVTTGAPCRAMWQLTHPTLHCLGRALIIL